MLIFFISTGLSIPHYIITGSNFANHPHTITYIKSTKQTAHRLNIILHQRFGLLDNHIFLKSNEQYYLDHPLSLAIHHPSPPPASASP
jgi:hypothetical protein